MIKLLRFLCVVLLNVPFYLLGGEINFVAQVNKNKVGIGEQFQITFTINASGNQFKAPSFEDFQFLGGPSQSTSMQIINGNMSQSVSYTYYLAGKKTGNYTLMPAIINVNGKKLESNPVKIEVTKEQVNQNQSQNQGNRPQSRQPNNQQAQNISEKELADNVFLKASVNKTQVYQGEQIVVTYKLYRRIDVLQYQLDNLPQYNGFWKEDLKTDNQTYTESLDGIQYSVTDIKKTILIPQRSGKLEIDPIDITVLIRLKAKRGNSMFDDFFGFGSYQNYNLPLKCKPITIQVKSMPPNEPGDFCGVAGSLKMDAKISKNKVNANESVTLKINVSGKGNLKIIEPFKLNLPEEIETYDPKGSNNINVSASGISGSKTFEYLLIPRNEGKYTIDPLSLSYFDIESGTYKTIKTESFELEVNPGTEGSTAIVGPQLSKKEDIKIKTNDINYIKSETNFKTSNDYFFGSWIYNLLFIIIICTTALAFVYLKRQNELKSDAKSYRKSQALKTAVQNLKLAKNSLDQNKSDVFYQTISTTIYNYFGDKLNVGIAQLNLDLIKTILNEKQISETAYYDVKNIIEACEIARFAPNAVSISKEEIYSTAEKLITNLDEKL